MSQTMYAKQPSTSAWIPSKFQVEDGCTVQKGTYTGDNHYVRVLATEEFRSGLDNEPWSR